MQVAHAALELAHAACAGDVRCLEAGAALGLVPAVGRYALPAWPRPLREQAVRFVHAVCHAGLPTARVLVACQARARASTCCSCLEADADQRHTAQWSAQPGG